MKHLLGIIFSFFLALLYTSTTHAATFGDYITTSKSFILYNLRDRTVLAEENSNQELPVASLTKIMTALIVLEDSPLKLTDKITITNDMLTGLDEFAVVGLKPGQTLTAEELLYALLLPSAGDAGQALAIATSGSIPDFAELMNKKAQELGLAHTHFSNPIGQDQDNYSTAADIATLLIHSLNNPTFKTIFEANSYDLAPLGKTIKKTISNYNLATDPLTGSKTGFTNAAGRCLASTATTGGADYLLVNLGSPISPNHLKDALAIYNYYGTHYSYRPLLTSGETLLELPVTASPTATISISAPEDFSYFLENTNDLSTFSATFSGVTSVDRRLHPGDQLGTITIKDGDQTIYSAPVYLAEDPTYYNYAPLFLLLLIISLPFLPIFLLFHLCIAILTPVTPSTADQPITLNSTPVNTEESAEQTSETQEETPVEPTKTTTKPAGNCTLSMGPLMLINPNFTVNTNWISSRKSHLINLTATYGIQESNSGNGTPYLDAEAAKALNNMLADYSAAHPGHILTTRSCFRPRGTTCGRLCAATGTSDHHSGYACDLVDTSYGTTLTTDATAAHPEWQWLHANSYKYGFIDRFPENWAGGSMSAPANIDANGTTGLYETWHFRYVGPAAATDIATGKYNHGAYDSLEHYLKASGRVTNLLDMTSCS